MEKSERWERILIPRKSEMGRHCFLLTEPSWTDRKCVVHSLLKFQLIVKRLLLLLRMNKDLCLHYVDLSDVFLQDPSAYPENTSKQPF